MLKKLVLIILTSCLSSYLYCKSSQKNYNPYKTYKSCANPVYSPDIGDSFFYKWSVRNKADIPSEQIEVNKDYFARYIQYYFAKNSLTLEGDFIECGVHHGGGASLFAFVLEQFDKNSRALYLLDTFAGFPGALIGQFDGNMREGGLSNTSVKQVDNVLRHYNCNYIIIPGMIPNTFAVLEDKKFSFVHIDLDLYESTKAAIEFLYPRTVAGGVLLFDDYGFLPPASKKALDEFFEDKIENICPLPTGQAFCIKK